MPTKRPHESRQKSNKNITFEAPKAHFVEPRIVQTPTWKRRAHTRTFRDPYNRFPSALLHYQGQGPPQQRLLLDRFCLSCTARRQARPQLHRVIVGSSSLGHLQGLRLRGRQNHRADDFEGGVWAPLHFFSVWPFSELSVLGLSGAFELCRFVFFSELGKPNKVSTCFSGLSGAEFSSCRFSKCSGFTFQTFLFVDTRSLSYRALASN